MKLWERIRDTLAALASGESLHALLGRIGAGTRPECSVAFTIAVLALGAKMAKADGRVTADEVAAFREIFHIRPEDETAAARVYDLARQDVAGFESYARQIARMFRHEPAMLRDIYSGLLHIALADGVLHEGEKGFLARVAEIFDISPREAACMKARLDPEGAADAFAVLGLSPDTPPAEARRRWRQLVRELHPDHVAARGMPAEAVRLANARLAAVNRAWAEIRRHYAATAA